MDSRSKILKALEVQLKSTAPLSIQPVITPAIDVEKSFCDVLVSIGGHVVNCNDYATAQEFIISNFATDSRIYTTIPELAGVVTTLSTGTRFEDVDLVVLQGLFGVAENGAVWITDAQLPDRVLPFITQNLVLVVSRTSIVPTLTEAYHEIGSAEYEFGMFVAGPSKTADIEQSLVLGAHGPKTMTVILLG
jgi:L-lactate dehydrogenase complex protein LldG